MSPMASAPNTFAARPAAWAGAGLESPRSRQLQADGILPEGTIHADDASSRVPVQELRTANRRDVFWSGDWIDRGNPVAWKSRASVLDEWRQHGNGQAAEWPSGRRINPDTDEDYATQSAFRVERLAVLGALDQWRTATVEQLASIAGVSQRTVLHPRVAGALLGSGLMDYGVPVAEMARSRRLRVPHLPVFRPGLEKQFEKLVRPNVSYGELVAITGGREFSASRQFDRHNMLATELGLRAAEFLPAAGAVVGEKLSRADLIFEGLEASQAGGDLTIVREDGLRIVVELTASVSDRFRDKVERWARLLDRHSLDSSGVVVLFVEAGKPDESGRSSSVLSQITKQISRAATAHPGLPGRSVADRMFVTSWSHLFPGDHLLSEDFLSLRAACPAGPSTGGGVMSQRWENRDLMDPRSVRLDPVSPESLRAVMVSAGMLAGSPFWMRSGRDVGVWNGMLDAVGIDRIPLRESQTSVRRADGTWGRPQGDPPPPGTLVGLGREASPRLASRGLPVVPLDSRLMHGVIERPASGEPAWEGWELDRSAQTGNMVHDEEAGFMEAAGFEGRDNPFADDDAGASFAAEQAVEEIDEFEGVDPTTLVPGIAELGEDAGEMLEEWGLTSREQLNELGIPTDQ